MSREAYRYSEDARHIIRNVHKFCLEEKSSGLQFSLAKVWERVVALTGVSRSTAQKIVSENESCTPTQGPGQSHRQVVVDEFDEEVIRRTINRMYSEKKVLPTIGNVHAELKTSISYTGSREHLRKQLIKMKFTYSRCSLNRRVLMEREDVVLSRIRYLRKIKELRDAGHTIIYTDETYVHTNHAVPKCWQDSSTGLKIPFSKGERMIVLHAGCDTGFVPGAELVFKAHCSSGDYHNEMNHNNFIKWLKEKLIPNIPANSVLVMDNAAYHNVQVDKCPTTSTKKADIQEWLRRQNIAFNGTLLKPELLELCRKYKHKPVYAVDEILARHGHQALRLPPYHADLNPIELIWGNLKGFIARNNLTFKLVKIKELIQQGMASITAQHWQDCIRHVKEIKRNYWSTNIAREDLHESIIIHLDESTDESETDTASEVEDEFDYEL